MAEIKKKLNIKRINLGNLFLLLLAVLVLLVIGLISKIIKGGAGIAGINLVQAQSCWTPPPGGSCDSGCQPAESGTLGSLTADAASVTDYIV